MDQAPGQGLHGDASGTWGKGCVGTRQAPRWPPWSYNTHLGGLLGDKRAHKLLPVLVPGRLGAAAQRVRSYFIPILQAWKLQINNLPGLMA